MGKQFLDKGYDPIDLDQALLEVVEGRDTLLPKQVVKGESSFNNYFFTSYATQHFTIKKNLHKHWDILRNDQMCEPPVA